MARVSVSRSDVRILLGQPAPTAISSSQTRHGPDRASGPSPRRFHLVRCSLIALVAANTLAAPVSATPPPDRTTEERRMSVSVADLNLNVDTDRAAARARIELAAASLCRRVVDTRSIDYHAALRDCAQEATRLASRQLEPTSMTAAR